MRKPRLLSVGALIWDTVFVLPQLPLSGGKYLPSHAMQFASGMAASAACAARRQGADASLWASVGDDAIGERLIADIAAEGVDCALVRKVAGTSSGFSTILLDADGERIIVPHYPAALLSDPAHVPGGFDAVLVDVRWVEAAARALIMARDDGIAGILDADVAPKAVLERLMPLASHIVASEPAAAIATGATDIMMATRLLASRFHATIVVTAGARGVCWQEPGSEIQHMAAPEVAAIDTLAAGDVFHGSFAVAIAEGWPLIDALRFASAAAAIKCTRLGGRLGAPDRAETLAFMRKTYGAGRIYR